MIRLVKKVYKRLLCQEFFKIICMSNLKKTLKIRYNENINDTQNFLKLYKSTRYSCGLIKDTLQILYATKRILHEYPDEVITFFN
jgi:hypothetical protein